MSCQSLDVEHKIIIDHLHDLLRKNIGSQVAIRTSIVQNRKDNYVVLLLELQHPHTKFIVKLAGPSAPYSCRFERVAAIHRLVSEQTTVPVAEIISADTTCHAFPWKYIIQSVISGRELSAIREEMSHEQVTNVAVEFGDAIAQVHCIEFPHFGEFDEDGLVERHGSLLPALWERATDTINDARCRALFLALLDENAHLFSDVGQACLCHDDLHKHNILVDSQGGSWRLSGILDFDKAWAGHGESDLARLELWGNMIQSEFWRAYERRRPIGSEYNQRRAIYQLL